MLENEATKQLGIKYPVIQAPMAGGVTTSKLVAEVSNCGGLGTIGAGYMSPGQIRNQINEIRQWTSCNFGINLFVPTEFNVIEEEVEAANHLLQPIQEQLKVPRTNYREVPLFEETSEIFRKQVKVVIEEKVPICSFTFGIPPKEVIDTFKQHDVVLVGTATSVEEALAIEESGMDIVVVQGSEAGGHRGAFIKADDSSPVGLMSLIPQVSDNVSIPVIGAGGIMDGRGLMASLLLGAEGVQMGTAFLTCLESGAHPLHKNAVLHAREDDTVLTKAFSGKWARGIVNEFITDMHRMKVSWPGFPVQNALTKGLRAASSRQNKKEFMSLWSGQSPRLAKAQTVKALMEDIVSSAEELMDRKIF
ncbi:NAD(P)H-dependent flavin oxidoreductase [Sediminibacillus massiliensis]|uniref:NAD(P)H-dependent flavin oxidoreductase n=1 Tax=Sediminibacillus massiliensis TaxID=1926277 RepID=UPI00098882FC|nr:nitronate monooxygenase [Sediminibacillus massiliensis]